MSWVCLGVAACPAADDADDGASTGDGGDASTSGGPTASDDGVSATSAAATSVSGGPTGSGDGPGTSDPGTSDAGTSGPGTSGPGTSGSDDTGAADDPPTCAPLGESCMTLDCCEVPDVDVACGSGSLCVDVTDCPGLEAPCKTDEDCCGDIVDLYCNVEVGQCWEA